MVVIVVMILMNIMLIVKVKMTMLLFSSCLLRHSPPFPRPVATQVYLSLPKYTPNSAVPPFLSPIPISHYQFSSPIGNFPISHSYRPLPSLRAYFLLAIAIAMAHSPLPVSDQKFTSHRYWSNFALDLPPGFWDKFISDMCTTLRSGEERSKCNQRGREGGRVHE